ncbi:hypothetical protein Taro_006683 [Colocasia esculenta]|uniref:Uncharacterized protein n=1 Tax=Colocasia esculenta TaxID=4460 RepID=A0A843TTD8_COLES|nr:hypothetical protein [Colocasia esculenta]
MFRLMRGGIICQMICVSDGTLRSSPDFENRASEVLPNHFSGAAESFWSVNSAADSPLLNGLAADSLLLIHLC